MIKDIVKDTFILSQPCSEATVKDSYVIEDLYVLWKA